MRKAKLGKAVETVKRLLHAERVPQFAGGCGQCVVFGPCPDGDGPAWDLAFGAGDVHHQYEDKYLLVERATCLAAASQLCPDTKSDFKGFDRF